MEAGAGPRPLAGLQPGGPDRPEGRPGAQALGVSGGWSDGGRRSRGRPERGGKCGVPDLWIFGPKIFKTSLVTDKVSLTFSTQWRLQRVAGT